MLLHLVFNNRRVVVDAVSNFGRSSYPGTFCLSGLFFYVFLFRGLHVNVALSLNNYSCPFVGDKEKCSLPVRVSMVVADAEPVEMSYRQAHEGRQEW